MNYDYILNCAYGKMREYGIILPRRMDIIHYADVEDFFARAENKKLTGTQISNRIVEIARNDYIATSARCNGKRIVSQKFCGSDAINFVAADDVL